MVTTEAVIEYEVNTNNNPQIKKNKLLPELARNYN